MGVEFPEYEDMKSSSEEVANEQSAQMLADSIEAGDPLITPPADPVATANLISMVDPEKVTPEDVETIAESTGSNPVFVEKVISLVAKSIEEAEETTQEAALENYSNRVHRLCNKVNFSDFAPIEGVTEEEKLMQAADIIPVFSDDVLNNVPSEEIATTMSEAMGGETESIEAIVSIAKNHMNDHINLNNDAVSDDVADDAVEEIGEESDEVIGTELEDNDPYATPMSDDELDSKIDTAITNSDEFAKQNFSYDVTDIVKDVSDAWASTKKDIARAAHQGAKSAIKALTRNPVYEGMASWNKTTLQPALVQMKKVGINNPGIIVATAVSPLAIAALASTISDVVSYKAAADEEESLNNEANAESLDNAAMSAGAKASISLANNARMNASRHFSSSFAGDLYTKEAKLVQLDQYKDELANCLLDLGAVFNNEQSFWPKLSNFISQYRYQVGGALAAILTALLPKFVSVNGTKLIIGVKNASFFERLSNIFNRDPAWIKELSKLDRYVRANPKMMSASFLMALGTAVAAWAQSVSPDKFKQFAPDIVEKLARVKFLETQIAQLESELGGAVASDLAAVTQPMEVIAKNFSLTEDTTAALELELNTPGKLTDSDTNVEPDTTAIGDPMLGIELEDSTSLSNDDSMNDNLSASIDEEIGSLPEVQPAPTTTSPADNNEASYIGPDIIAAGQQGAVTGGDEPVLESAAELSSSERDNKDNDLQLEDEIIADNINLTPEMVEGASTAQAFSNSIRRDRMRQSRYFSRWNFAEPASNENDAGGRGFKATIQDLNGNVIDVVKSQPGDKLIFTCEQVAKQTDPETLKTVVDKSAQQLANEQKVAGNIMEDSTPAPSPADAASDAASDELLVKELNEAADFVNGVWASDSLRQYVVLLLSLIEAGADAPKLNCSAEEFLELQRKVLNDIQNFYITSHFQALASIYNSVNKNKSISAADACKEAKETFDTAWRAIISEFLADAQLDRTKVLTADDAAVAYNHVLGLIQIMVSGDNLDVLKDIEKLLAKFVEQYQAHIETAIESESIDPKKLKNDIACTLCYTAVNAADGVNPDTTKRIIGNAFYEKLCKSEQFDDSIPFDDVVKFIDQIYDIIAQPSTDRSYAKKTLQQDFMATAKEIINLLKVTTDAELQALGKKATTETSGNATRMWNLLKSLADSCKGRLDQVRALIANLNEYVGNISKLVADPQTCVKLAKNINTFFDGSDKNVQKSAAASIGDIVGYGTFVHKVLLNTPEGAKRIAQKQANDAAFAGGQAMFRATLAKAKLAVVQGFMKVAGGLSSLSPQSKMAATARGIAHEAAETADLKQMIADVQALNNNEIMTVIDALKAFNNSKVKDASALTVDSPAAQALINKYLGKWQTMQKAELDDLIKRIENRIEDERLMNELMTDVAPLHFSRARYAQQLDNLRRIKIAMRRYYSAMGSNEDMMISDAVAYDAMPEDEEDFCGTGFCKTKKGQFCGTKSFSKKRKAVNPFGRYYFADEGEDEEEEVPAEANADDASEDESYDEPMDGDAGFEAENDEDFGDNAGWDEEPVDNASEDEFPEEEVDDYDMSADEVDAESAEPAEGELDDATSDYVTAPAVVAPTGEDMSIGHWEDPVVDSSLDDESMRQSPFADQYDSKPGENTLSATNAGEAMALQNDMMTLRGIDQFKGESNFSRTRKAALRKSSENSAVSGLRALLGDKYIK